MQEANPLIGLREAIAEAIRIEMTRKRKTQRALGEETGLSQSYLGRRLVGQMAFNTDDLVLIAIALGVPVSSFMPAPERVA